MRLTLISLIMIFSASSFAKSFTFFYSGFEGRNRVMLSCHYVEGRISEIMNDIKAESFDIDCRGGLDFNWYTPITVTVDFEEHISTNAGEIIDIKSGFNDNCYFDTRFMRRLIDEHPNLEALRKREGCSLQILAIVTN
jgi:hypothetical protein